MPFRTPISSRERRRLVLASLGMSGLLAVPAVALAQASAQPLLLMAGAGYKRPVEALCAAFTQQTGIAVDRSYGNLQQVFAQARASGRVDVLVGDADFINKAKDLALPQRTGLGQGVMALAWRKGLEVKAGSVGHAMARELLGLPGLSVGMPNPQQAIYGNAASQWLRAQGLWGGVQERLKTVGTVPQVTAYLTSGQVDLGFVNLTEALAVKDQLGGFTSLPAGADSYTAIEIVAAMPAAGEQVATQASRERFAAFLATPTAQDLLRRAGL
ncbi:molybdate ABC transporter substrate-binding protein [Hydrogenophaga sp.]|uniref:molybdate ABC transporter substrate-binding protein n=1 Tax=Hydrogenophaga sp. TaxID=1904254 RepID=UPI0035B04546